MTRLHLWLSGILFLQLILAFGLLLGGATKDVNPKEPLMIFDRQQLDKIVIKDQEGSLSLVKSDQRWIIPEADKLPAGDSKISTLLSNLQGLSAGWPVATTPSSHQRFEVDKEKYQRWLQLYQGGTMVGELYIGTSPGFRKVHVRKAEDDAVYSVPLDGYELGSSISTWLDKSLLAAKDIVRIQGTDFTLKKTDGKWGFDYSESSLERMGKGQTEIEPDPEKVQQLVSALENLQVLNVVGNTPDKKSSGISVTKLEVSGPDGGWTYYFSQSGDQYLVSRSDVKKDFTISKFDYERLALKGGSELIRKESESNMETDEIASSPAS